MGDCWIRNKKEVIHKYSDPSGSQLEAQEKLEHLQALLSNMEDGQVKLNSVVTSSDCLVGVLSSTRSCLLIQQNTKACREKWKNFLTLLREKEQILRNYVQQTKEVEKSVCEITKWFERMENNFQNESGLRGSISCKKKQKDGLQLKKKKKKKKKGFKQKKKKKKKKKS